ncbi:MAG: type I restriction enzyme HsdR N-terminal domain-containing protein [Sphingobacteriales bacterium]|nr:MAG: type I restriction enzyme HsdR N-terminal domain-containing protein [Sphingobacteriales bacterium]TAF78330.1 MAG: type I restriction enzyme HsdR N-terminal domain-containing protein [Sphingobacteriales bacterium]
MFITRPLNLPAYPFRLTQVEGKLYIFDKLRKKKLLLSPEEWVRQHFVQFLINDKKYPPSLIKLEGGVKINTHLNRTDILVYNSFGTPFILVECKASTVKINQKVFDQAARYNAVHQVTYLVISNGLQHYCCQMDYENHTYKFIQEIPQYIADV